MIYICSDIPATVTAFLTLRLQAFIKLIVDMRLHCGTYLYNHNCLHESMPGHPMLVSEEEKTIPHPHFHI